MSHGKLGGGSRHGQSGESWEIYTVLADSPAFFGEGHGPECCGGLGGRTDQPAQAGSGPLLPAAANRTSRARRIIRRAGPTPSRRIVR